MTAPAPLPPSLAALDFLPVLSCNTLGCPDEPSEILVSVHRSDASECSRRSFCPAHVDAWDRWLRVNADGLVCTDHNIPATWEWDRAEAEA